MSELNKDSNNKKRSLGRGLGSLLATHGAMSNEEMAEPVAPPQSPKVSSQKLDTLTTQSVDSRDQTERVLEIAIEKLKASPYQPRTTFPREKLEELAQSIRVHGVLQPITVRKQGSSYEIIAGERRWRAAQIAGLHLVPAIVKNFDDKQTLEIALIENLQREDLNPIEEAESFSRLMSEFQMTQAQVAERVGKERATVANAVRLLQLEPTVREMLVRNEISVGHAKVLLAVTQPKVQINWAKKVTKQAMSVRKLEKEVQESLIPDREVNSGAAPLKQRLTQAVAEELQKKWQTKVEINAQNGKGTIVMHFYSDDQFNEMVEKMRNIK